VPFHQESADQQSLAGDLSQLAASELEYSSVLGYCCLDEKIPIVCGLCHWNEAVLLTMAHCDSSLICYYYCHFKVVCPGEPRSASSQSGPPPHVLENLWY